MAGMTERKTPPMHFIDTGFISRLDTLSETDANAAPHGVVKLDDAGVVQLYNQWESEMAGLPAAAVVGKNFFVEVAPCTNNPLFAGRFEEIVAGRAREVAFDYTFSFRLRPKKVSIVLYRHLPGPTNWIFVALR